MRRWLSHQSHSPLSQSAGSAQVTDVVSLYSVDGNIYIEQRIELERGAGGLTPSPAFQQEK